MWVRNACPCNYFKIRCKMELVFGENFTALSEIFVNILKSIKEIIDEGSLKIRDKRDVKNKGAKREMN